MNIKEAKEIVNEKVSGEIIKIEPIVFGGDSTTFKIVSEKENYILRTGGKRSNYDVEHAILKLLLDKGANVPIPIAHSININNPNLSFSLQKEIPGIDLFRSKLYIASWHKIIKTAGENLKIVHSLKFPGFGPISTDIFRSKGKIVGSFNSYFDFINYFFHSRVDEFLKKIEIDKANNFKNSNLKKKNIEKILQIISKIPVAIERIESLRNFLFEGNTSHGDLSPQHIMVNKKKFTGIIDFNNVLIAEPLFDIAYWSIMPKGDLYLELAGSAGISINMPRFRLYRLLISICKINTRYVTHDYLNNYPEILDFALEELNK